MKYALLIIDLQVGLFDGPGKPFEYEDVIFNINKLSGVARKLDYPVIFIQHETMEEVLEYKSKGWALVDALVVDSIDHTVRKTTPNSFANQTLGVTMEKKCNENSLLLNGIDQ